MNILTLIINQYKYKQLFFCNIHTEYYDDVLILKSPKILKSTISDSQFSLDVDDIINHDNTKGNGSVRFDKKNKSTVINEDQDLMKLKKNKVKLNKNKHKNDNHDVDSIVISEDNLFKSDLKSRSQLKSRKVVLKNKKNKAKNQSSNNTILDISSAENVTKEYDSRHKFPKDIFIDDVLSVKDLSIKIDIPEAEIITYLFLNKSISATINEVLDIDLCIDVIKHYGFNLVNDKVTELSVSNNYLDNNMTPDSIERSPIITILGHVDHGKTTLLDSILNTSLASQEQGGITQSVVAYETTYFVNAKKYKLTFLDTPGHEAFTTMRIRGAKITDIVLLVVAVDDGLRPQTQEAIEYIKQMSLSCIVVVTKTDKSLNNLDKIKDNLAQCGLLCEEWGGDIALVKVSGLTGYNIDYLLEKICSLAKSKNLYAESNQLASGTIIDASLDQKKGPIATIIVQNGTLKIGDIIVVNSLFGKVKSIIDSNGLNVKYSGPSSIIKVLCFSSLPKVGSCFCCFNNEKEAKKHINSLSITNDSTMPLKSLNSRISGDPNLSRKQLKLIVKADTQGSLEAIINLFSTISQSKVQINFISASFGNITNNDIDLSIASESPILAFNVSVLPQINILLKKHQINFKTFYIIYELFEYVQDLMLDLLDPEYSSILIGNAVVQTVFKTNRGNVAGCTVTNGKISQSSYIKVYRENLLMYEGYINSLKFMKNNVEEVLSPSECGLMSDFYEWQKSDLIEVYEMIIKEKAL